MRKVISLTLTERCDELIVVIVPINEAEEKEWKHAARADRETQNKLLAKTFKDAGWQSERLLEQFVHATRCILALTNPCRSAKASDFYFQSIDQIKLSPWSKGRVVCIGDCAHAPTPLTGAGTSLAIVGAYVLAGELSVKEDPTEALQAYETMYRPFVEKIQNIPSFVPSIAHPATPFKLWIARTFLRLMALGVWLASFPAKLLPVFTPAEEDFPLPHYPALEESDSISKASTDIGALSGE